MVIKDSFVIVEEALYSLQFDGEESDELTKLFSQWSDPTYLHDFFDLHKSDLDAGFFGKVSIEEAVRHTRKESKQLRNRLYDVASEGAATEAQQNLSTLFKPLTHGEPREFERSKAYGALHGRSWLRIYAIRVNVNVFVICGGAIKLTQTMEERAHLNTELKKLDIAKEYVESDDQFFELSL